MRYALLQGCFRAHVLDVRSVDNSRTFLFLFGKDLFWRETDLLILRRLVAREVDHPEIFEVVLPFSSACGEFLGFRPIKRTELL